MARLSRQIRIWAGQLMLLVIGLLVYPLAACSDDQGLPGFPLRNQNPFIQIFGLPSFQSAYLAADGSPGYTISLDLANHAEARDNGDERIVFDGESYFLTVSAHRRMASWLQLGVELPLVAHGEGFMDNAIEGWHDAFGMSNTKRRGLSNQLSVLYESAGTTKYELSSPAFGIGDVQLTAAIPIRKPDGNDGYALTVRSGLKLPTGDENKLLGSGAADFSVGVYASNTHVLLDRDLGLTGFAGVLLLGEGDVLSDIQRSTVAFGGAAATWQATQRFAISSQLYIQDAYFDSELKELGGRTLQLAVGGDYRPSGSDLSLRFAVVEDVSANATTDFALHFSIIVWGGR